MISKRDTLEAKYNDGITIEPGSRPTSVFDSDPSVSCFHNSYQKKCLAYDVDWNTERRYYTNYSINGGKYVELLAEQLPCTNFYNQSDNRLIWWQQLQRQAVHQPAFAALFMDNDNQCPEENEIDFYITEKKDSLKKYVDFNRGLYLRREGDVHPNSLSLCYITDQPDLPITYYVNVAYSFTHCLFDYGSDIFNTNY